MLANNYQKYQQNAVFTASPQELTLMLYNGAIKFCNMSKEMLDQNNLEKANYFILKVQDIVQELLITLDDKYDISQEMRVLYDYILQLLIQANIYKDEVKLLEARELLVNFRDLWKEVMVNVKAN